MNRLAPPAAVGTPASRSHATRVGIAVVVIAYVALAALAVLSANGLLAVACVLLLATVVLARGLVAARPSAWLAWLAITALLGLLVVRGSGALALEGLPVAANLALAGLFGYTLLDGRTPLIARAILAMDGPERLALPRVARYARGLTLAWAVLLFAQAVLLVLVVGARHGLFAAPASSLASAYLFLGGWFVPAAFMLGEYAFRRWHLRELPHDPPQRFLRRLAASWPKLLRDSARQVDAGR